MSFPGFHQPESLKKARGKNQTLPGTQLLLLQMCIGIVVLGGLGDIRINLVLHLLCKTKKGITSWIIDILTLLTLTIVMGSISDTRLLKHTQRLINSGFTAQVEL